jgi:hypothetical protein
MAQQQMSNAPRRPRDLNQWAKRMLDIGAGEVKDWAPSPDEGGQRPDHVPLFEEASYVRNNPSTCRPITRLACASRRDDRRGLQQERGSEPMASCRYKEDIAEKSRIDPTQTVGRPHPSIEGLAEES